MPVVGKSFYTECKKCETDRYFTVLALPTPTSAKIKCEVCGSQKTWKAQTTKKTVSTAPRGAAAKARATAEAKRASDHAAEYETLTQNFGSATETSYNMKTVFVKEAKLKHPKFGLGFVRSVQPDKIEVVFQDEVRTLVHNRR